MNQLIIDYFKLKMLKNCINSKNRLTLRLHNLKNSFKMKRILLIAGLIFSGVGSVFSQCGVGQSELFLTTSGGNYPTEKWVTITTGPNGTGTVIWAQGNGTLGNGAGLLTNQPFCVDDGTTYYINAYDAYDDSWDGTTYAITDQFGTVVANNGGSSPNDANDDDFDSSWEDAVIELESSEAFSYTAPSCAPPSGLSTANLTTTSVDLVWVSNGAETVWNIEYGTAGFVIGAGTPVLDNDGTLGETLNSLSPETAYQFYVQADCGGSTSSWVGPFSFYTGYCVPTTTYTGDYTSGFSTSGANMNVTYTASSQPAGSYDDQTAEVIEHFASGSFDFSHTYVGGSNGLNIWVDWNNDLVFDASENMYYGTTSNATQTGTITIPVTAVIGDYRMRVRSQWGSSANPPSCGEVAYGSTIDYTLTISAPPTCPPVSAILVDSISYNSITVGWTPQGSETSWNIEYGEQGFAIGTGMTATVGSPEALIQNLDPNTTYDIYIQADCGAGDLSTNQTISATTYRSMNCGDVFTDTGGESGDYTNNQNIVWQICASTPNEVVVVDFTEFELESNEFNDYDYLVIKSDDTEIGLFSWDNNPGMVISNAGGCLTFEFTSDGSGVYPGWVADVTCGACVPAAGVDGEVDICFQSGTIDLNTVITQGETNGTWYFESNPSLLNNSTVQIGTLFPASYEAYYVTGIENVPGCNTDTTYATFEVFASSSAGENGVLTACMNQPINLLGGLVGTVDHGGVWTGPNGNVPNGYFTTGQLPGQFNYTYVTSNGVCPNDTSEVLVNVQPCDYLSIEEIAFEGITVYPNPSNGMFFISNQENGQDFSFEVVDLNGKVLVDKKSVVGSTKTELDLTTVQSGVYMIRLTSETGQKMIRIVKN